MAALLPVRRPCAAAAAARSSARSAPIAGRLVGAIGGNPIDHALLGGGGTTRTQKGRGSPTST